MVSNSRPINEIANESADNLFLSMIGDPVRMMREAGMNEIIVAAVLCDVRTATITAERHRQKVLQGQCPPSFPGGQLMMAKVQEWQPSK